MNTLVSIIIPTFNRGHLIGETLDSILDQTYNNWECIIVDDGSTDNTKEVIEEYLKKDSRFLYYHRPKDRLPGGNAARNFGFEVSKGEFIQWFDSDDLMKTNYLELQTENIIKLNVDFSICLMDRYNYDFSILLKESKFNSIKNTLYVDFILKDLKAALQTILWSKQFVKNFSLNDNLLKSQEYDFLSRIFNGLNKNYALLNERLIKIRRHKDSITGGNKHIEKGKLISALKVRADIMENIANQSYSKEIQLRFLVLYLEFLKGVFICKRTSIFYIYLVKCFKIKQVEVWFILLRISCLYPIYFFSNKGLSYYSTVLNKIQS